MSSRAKRRRDALQRTRHPTGRVPHICPGLADVGNARSASAFVFLLSSRPERAARSGGTCCWLCPASGSRVHLVEWEELQPPGRRPRSRLPDPGPPTRTQQPTANPAAPNPSSTSSPPAGAAPRSSPLKSSGAGSSASHSSPCSPSHLSASGTQPAPKSATPASSTSPSKCR